jgi:hypothetical protein
MFKTEGAGSPEALAALSVVLYVVSCLHYLAVEPRGHLRDRLRRFRLVETG